MKNKTNWVYFLIFLLAGCAVFLGLKYYKSVEDKAFNESFMLQYNAGMVSAHNLKDSLDFLIKEDQLIKKLPYSEKLTIDSKQRVENDLKIVREIKKQKEDYAAYVRADKQAWDDARTSGSVDAYLSYISNFPKGKYVEKAKSEIKNKQSNALVVSNVLTNKPPKRVYHSKALKVKKLICITKNDLGASDEVILKLNGTSYLDKYAMTSGDEVDLTKMIAPIKLTKDGIVTISLLEDDLPMRTEILLSSMIKGNNIEPKTYQMENTKGRGKYILTYVIE